MGESTNKSDSHETRAVLPQMIGTALVEGAESMLQAQAGLLADIEETVTSSLRTQQETLRKIIELMSEARNAGSLADHVKLQLAASEQCLNSSLALWRDTTSKWSQLTMKRLEAGRKSVTAVADDAQRTGWGVVDKAAAAKGSARKAAEAA